MALQQKQASQDQKFGNVTVYLQYTFTVAYFQYTIVSKMKI
jgi:hypothetical protein